MISGIKSVSDVLKADETDLYDLAGGRKDLKPLEKGRRYIIPGYQREIKWNDRLVQMLVDDLTKGDKFLGTIALSSSKIGEYEVMDGQQRLTVIRMFIKYLNSKVSPDKQIGPLCELTNATFPYLDEALRYDFDYELIKERNMELYENIIRIDVLEQKEDLRKIWLCLKERIDSKNQSEQENLLTALVESDLNLIVDYIREKKNDRKFCVNYFLDINNKRIELDGVDFIRAYAFKAGFERMSKKWIEIQDKCSKLCGTGGKIKYSREELYYQYFVCKINKELDYRLTKAPSENYTITENIHLHGKLYSSGTNVWYMFSNDRFYEEMLEDLSGYLDFMQIVVDTGNGISKSFREYFKKDDGSFISNVTISNALTIICDILLHDDVVPKMMIMKLYLEILKKDNLKSGTYKSIYPIFVIATLFSINGKGRKSSGQIASRLLLKEWDKELDTYAYKLAQKMQDIIDFAKVCKIGGVDNSVSGQYMARRYYSMRDTLSWEHGNISPNEQKFMCSRIRTGAYNDEHFIINRNYQYALYETDGKDELVSIKLPARYRKYIATLANYIILNSEINSLLKNRPVYEKVEILEQVIAEQGINQVIPSSRSQLHYYLIKKVLHDESRYPYIQIQNAPNKKEKKALLKEYYATYFKEEFSMLAELLKQEEILKQERTDYLEKRMKSGMEEAATTRE